MKRKQEKTVFFLKCYKCYIVKNIVSSVVKNAVSNPVIFDDWYCGYIEIQKGHKFFEKNFEELINCHGGITYNNLADNIRTIGFDCNHFGDKIKVQDFVYTKNEIEHILVQLGESPLLEKIKIIKKF